MSRATYGERTTMADEQVTIDHVVLGASNLATTTDFLAALGFSAGPIRDLPAEAAAALYGLDRATREVTMTAAGRAAGAVRVVQTGIAAPAPDPYRRGGHALDLYTTDIERSGEISRAAGATVGPLADYDFGPVHLRQSQATGPDGVPVVFVEIAHRLPSALDDQPDLLHSELHSVVWSVDDIEAATAFWTDVVGLELRSRFPITEPAVSAFMGLPRPTPLVMSVLTGPDAAAPRMELLAYDGEPGGHVPVAPLVPGATIPVVTTTDLDSTVARLVAAGSAPRPVVAAPAADGAHQRACVVAGPSGTGLELRERRPA
jgi:catechol 2,3-dioxygenase-like lactoylglutathione lyase family enzyme